VSLQLNIEAHLKGACITLISLYALMKDLSKWRDDHLSLIPLCTMEAVRFRIQGI
jgi:hypothetical protein